MSTQTLNLTPKVYQYLLDVSIREKPVLKDLREATKQLSGAVMQVSPEGGQFMALLTELIGAKKTLDIGTFTGYSALVVALTLPTDGKVHSFDLDERNTTIAKTYWEKAGIGNKIQLHLGKASQHLQNLIDQGEIGTFDFAFIDADKNNYDDYYEKALKLLRPGGLIAIDNVLWDGAVADPTINDPQTQALRSLNKKLLTDERVSISMVPIGDGVTLVRKH